MSASVTGKRYCDIPGVSLEVARIPTVLRPLLKVAIEWAIVGDNALERAIRKAGKAKIRRAVQQAWPLKEQIHQYAYYSKGSKETPIPHEVVVFQMFAWSLNRLEVEVHEPRA